MKRWLRIQGLSTLAVPMVVWAVHFVLLYAVAGVACEHGWRRWRHLGLDALTWLLLAFGVVALVLLGLLAWRSTHVAQTTPPAVAGDGETPSRPRFVARATLALCLLSAIAVIYSTIPVFMLRPCR